MAEKNNKYACRLTWSEDDSEYAGLCAEFPGVSWLARTPEAALKGIRKLASNIIADMMHNGESVPEPLATRYVSRKFMVRVPPVVLPELLCDNFAYGTAARKRSKIVRMLTFPACDHDLQIFWLECNGNKGIRCNITEFFSKGSLIRACPCP